MAAVQLWKDKNFTGTSYSIASATQIPDLKSTPVGNDNVSSAKVASGYRAIFYQDSNYRGDSYRVTGPADIPNFDDIGFNDRASSLMVQNFAPQAAIATLFTEANFLGKPFDLYPGDAIPQFKSTNIGQDSVSSIRVSPGYRVILFADPNYTGTTLPITGPTSITNLKDVGFNDVTNSAKVEVASPLGAVIATIYSDDNFKGRTWDLRAGDQIPNLGSLPFGAGAITSIKVQPGYTVSLFSNPNFQSTRVDIVGPAQIADLRGFNDDADSLQVSGTGLHGTPSGNTVNGIATQTAPFLSYDRCPSNCTAFNDTRSCYNNDWQYDTRRCGLTCKSQPQCSVLNTGVCPQVGGGPIGVSWVNTANNKGASSQVNCTYDVSTITQPSDIDTWLSAPWANKVDAIQQYDSKIMPNYCNVQVTTCPIDPNTSKQMDKCSRFASTGLDGQKCREWVTNGLSGTNGFGPGNSNTTMQKYCSTNNTLDCACINRSQNETYRQFTGLTAGAKTLPNTYGPDSCWFIPCKFPEQIMVTSDLAKPTCNIQICQALQNIYDNQFSVINTGDLKANISCDFSQPGAAPIQTTEIPPSTTPIGTTPAGTTPNGTTPNGTTPNGTTPNGTTPAGTTPVGTRPVGTTSARRGTPIWVWIVIAIVVLLIIAAVIGAIIFATRRRPPT